MIDCSCAVILSDVLDRQVTRQQGYLKELPFIPLKARSWLTMEAHRTASRMCGASVAPTSHSTSSSPTTVS